MRQPRANGEFGAENIFSPWPACPAGLLVLVVTSFVYVWLRIEPALEYHSFGPFFYKHPAFFERIAGHPGGLAEYAGVLLAQLNWRSWLGALSFAAAQSAVILITAFCLRRISGRSAGWAVLFPAFLLLLLRNRYGCAGAAMTLGLGLALSATAAYVALPGRRAWVLTATAGLISGVLFVVAGLWSALLFAVLSGVFLIVQKRNWRAGLGSVGLALLWPLLMIGAGELRLARLLNPWPGGLDWVFAAALYASIPCAALVMNWLPKRTQTTSNIRQPPLQGRSAFRPGTPIINRSWAVMILGFLIGWAAVWLMFDRRLKLQAGIDYQVNCGQYQAALAMARRAAALNHPAKVRLQLALYHTGGLSEDLFSYFNLIDDAPLRTLGETWRAQSQPLFELGLVNDAEHMAHEALELEGDRPDLLRLLARINRVKKRPQAAQVFLNVLSTIPFQGESANPAWPGGEPQVSAAERDFLEAMRAQMLTNDVPHDSAGPMLDVLLISQPTNRMAFEYVMAHYLVNRELKKAVERLQFLDHFNYTRTPRSYAEAVLLYEQLAAVHVEIPGLVIRDETVERFQRFRQAVRQLKGTAEGLAAVAADFGDTYWCYYYAKPKREPAAEGQAIERQATAR
jgi:hypothetical protein